MSKAQKDNLYIKNTIEKNKPFFNYCKKFPCNLFDVVNEAWNSFKSEIELNKAEEVQITLVNNIQSDFLIDFHHSYLVFILVNVFKNANKPTKNKGAIINFLIDNDFIIINQNKKFIISTQNRIGGIEKFIKPICIAFLGDNCIELDNSKDDSFTIKIK